MGEIAAKLRSIKEHIQEFRRNVEQEKVRVTSIIEEIHNSESFQNSENSKTEISKNIEKRSPVKRKVVTPKHKSSRNRTEYLRRTKHREIPMPSIVLSSSSDDSNESDLVMQARKLLNTTNSAVSKLNHKPTKNAPNTKKQQPYAFSNHSVSKTRTYAPKKLEKKQRLNEKNFILMSKTFSESNSDVSDSKKDEDSENMISPYQSEAESDSVVISDYYSDNEAKKEDKMLDAIPDEVLLQPIKPMKKSDANTKQAKCRDVQKDETKTEERHRHKHRSERRHRHTNHSQSNTERRHRHQRHKQQDDVEISEYKSQKHEESVEISEYRSEKHEYSDNKEENIEISEYQSEKHEEENIEISEYRSEKHEYSDNKEENIEISEYRSEKHEYSTTISDYEPVNYNSDSYAGKRQSCIKEQKDNFDYSDDSGYNDDDPTTVVGDKHDVAQPDVVEEEEVAANEEMISAPPFELIIDTPQEDSRNKDENGTSLATTDIAMMSEATMTNENEKEDTRKEEEIKVEEQEREVAVKDQIVSEEVKGDMIMTSEFEIKKESVSEQPTIEIVQTKDEDKPMESDTSAMPVMMLSEISAVNDTDSVCVIPPDYLDF